MQRQNSKFRQPNSIWCPSDVLGPQAVGIAIPTYLENARLEHLGQPAAYLSHIKDNTKVHLLESLKQNISNSSHFHTRDLPYTWGGGGGRQRVPQVAFWFPSFRTVKF